MSRELIFYPAFKDSKSNKYKPLLLDAEGNPASIFWRSGSFIDLNYFTTEIPMTKSDEFEDSCKDYFTGRYDNLGGESSPTYVYVLTKDLLEKVGQSFGLVSGYALLDEMKIFYECDCPQEYFFWEMEKPIPAELYAELPEEERKKYGRFSTIDCYSKEYVCNILSEVLADIDVPYEWDGDKVILVLFSF